MNTKQRMSPKSAPLAKLTIAIVALAFWVACASTGEKVAKKSSTASVRNLGVTVEVRKNLEVLNATEDSAFLGALLFGLIGDEIQESARRNRDNKTAEPMRPHMTMADYRQRAESKLAEVLRQSGKFQSV